MALPQEPVVPVEPVTNVPNEDGGRPDVVAQGLDRNRDGFPPRLQAPMSHGCGNTYMAAPVAVPQAACPVYLAPPQVMATGPTLLQVAQPQVNVVKPVIQEVVREVPVHQRELHTIFRERPQVEFVEKAVEVPKVEVQERVMEVPQVLLHEKVMEVPQVREDEIVKQVPRVEYTDVSKHIELPVFEAQERIVEVPFVIEQECLVEVPQVHCIELIREVPKEVVKTVQKMVERPVVQVREQNVEVPVVTVQEELVPVPVVEEVEVITQVPSYELQQVEKRVELPVVELQEKLVEVPQAEVVENPVEVPEVEICEIIKQVPKYEIHYIDKEVIKHQVEYVEKLVEVPHVVYEERIIEVPQVERRELIRHVPVSNVQMVDKKVPKHTLKVTEKVVEVPTVLHHEKPIEVPEVAVVETITEVPKVMVNSIPVEVPKVVNVQIQERLEEVRATLIAERAVEVPDPQVVEAITQVVQPIVQYVDKEVPRVVTEPVERLQEVWQRPLVEEVAVPVDQVLTYEAVRQEASQVVHEALKPVSPKDAVPADGAQRVPGPPSERPGAAMPTGSGPAQDVDASHNWHVDGVESKDDSDASLDVHRKRPVPPLSFEKETLIFQSDVDMQEIVAMSRWKCLLGGGLGLTGFYALLASLSLHGSLPFELAMVFSAGLCANAYAHFVTAQKLIRKLAARHVDQLWVMPLEAKEKPQEKGGAHSLLLETASTEERLAATPSLDLRLKTASSERWLSLVEPMVDESLKFKLDDDSADLSQKASMHEIFNLGLLDIDESAGKCHDTPLLAALKLSKKVVAEETAEPRTDIAPFLRVPEGAPAPGERLDTVAASEVERAIKVKVETGVVPSIEAIGWRAQWSGAAILVAGCLFSVGERARDKDGTARWNKLKLPWQ
ncbi:unnamed protein product [Symbiodinium natans]|uniref:Uncharacterized protein n=1 Tax=Symbiodinium natans TaxID=878477 RepID=A0A812TPE5_9DINO|nr:unnamed protein product [Symbiodinium natans]